MLCGSARPPVSQSHTRSFFLSERGTRVTEWALRWTFVKLSRQIGLRAASDSHGPRLHDFRHRFAVSALLRWYRRGVDVERHLPDLATYLGQSKRRMPILNHNAARAHRHGHLVGVLPRIDRVPRLLSVRTHICPVVCYTTTYERRT